MFCFAQDNFDVRLSVLSFGARSGQVSLKRMFIYHIISASIVLSCESAFAQERSWDDRVIGTEVPRASWNRRSQPLGAKTSPTAEQAFPITSCVPNYPLRCLFYTQFKSDFDSNSGLNFGRIVDHFVARPSSSSHTPCLLRKYQMRLMRMMRYQDLLFEKFLHLSSAQRQGKMELEVWKCLIPSISTLGLNRNNPWTNNRKRQLLA